MAVGSPNGVELTEFVPPLNEGEQRVDVCPILADLLLPLGTMSPDPTAFEFYETEPFHWVCQEKVSVRY